MASTMAIYHHLEGSFEKRTGVHIAKRRSLVLGHLLDLFMDHDTEVTNREARAAIYSLLGAWGRELSRDIWEVVTARAQFTRGSISVCHGSEFERLLGPITVDLRAYELVAWIQ